MTHNFTAGQWVRVKATSECFTLDEVSDDWTTSPPWVYSGGVYYKPHEVEAMSRGSIELAKMGQWEPPDEGGKQ